MCQFKVQGFGYRYMPMDIIGCFYEGTPIRLQVPSQTVLWLEVLISKFLPGPAAEENDRVSLCTHWRLYKTSKSYLLNLIALCHPLTTSWAECKFCKSSSWPRWLRGRAWRWHIPFWLLLSLYFWCLIWKFWLTQPETCQSAAQLPNSLSDTSPPCQLHLRRLLKLDLNGDCTIMGQETGATQGFSENGSRVRRARRQSHQSGPGLSDGWNALIPRPRGHPATADLHKQLAGVEHDRWSDSRSGQRMAIESSCLDICCV